MREFKCTMCGESFDDLDKLEQHLRDAHGIDLTGGLREEIEKLKEIKQSKKKQDKQTRQRKSAEDNRVSQVVLDLEERVSNLESTLKTITEKIDELVTVLTNGGQARQVQQQSNVIRIPAYEVEVEKDKGMNIARVTVPIEVILYYNAFKSALKKHGIGWKGNIGDFIMQAVKKTLEDLGILPAVLVAPPEEYIVLKSSGFGGVMDVGEAE